MDQSDVKETMTPLRKLRKARGFSTTEVAKAVGLDQSTYSRIETSGATSREKAEAIADWFGREWITELHILYPDRFPDFMEQGGLAKAG